MAHRNYSKPRSGHLGFLPKCRCKFSRPQIKYFKPATEEGKPHVAGFITFKAGCTHVMGKLEERMTGKKVIKQVIRQVTVLDAPPMVAIGIVGYVRTPAGYKAAHTVWAEHIGESVIKRVEGRTVDKQFLGEKGGFHAFKTHNKGGDAKKKMAEKLALIKNECEIIKLICHTQPEKTPLAVRRAHIIELQIDGGNFDAKLKFAQDQLEKEISVSNVFQDGQQVDTISITRGRGFEGVVTRWGVTRLPRKTRRGNRKVACIGSWHPANVQYTVARAGQQGYFHRTEANKQILKIGDGSKANCCKTEYDTTDKGVNPLGGWVGYGSIRGDFVMIAGSCPGVKRRPVCLRHAVNPTLNVPPFTLDWICMASKMGHGIFETAEEKKHFYAKKGGK